MDVFGELKIKHPQMFVIWEEGPVLQVPNSIFEAFCMALYTR